MAALPAWGGARRGGRPPAPGDLRMTDERRELIRATPALAKIAAAAWWRGAQWTLDLSVRTSQRMVRAARTGESPAQLFQEAGADGRTHRRALLADAGPEEASSNGRPESDDATPAGLRRKGADLLNRSADVDLDEDIHPAYARILDEL